ncbi:MAG: hypothetical protein ACLQVY_26580 [Limisphaerales bacterium]
MHLEKCLLSLAGWLRHEIVLLTKFHLNLHLASDFGAISEQCKGCEKKFFLREHLLVDLLLLLQILSSIVTNQLDAFCFCGMARLVILMRFG